MNRRLFVHALAGAGALSQAAVAGAQQTSAKTRIYRLDFFHYRQGDQASRLNGFFSAVAPLMLKQARVVGVFTGVFAPRTQVMLVLSGYAGIEATAAATRLDGDSQYAKAFEALESGAAPAYDKLDSVLLGATDFSPEITPLAERPKTARYFELRVYHSPTWRQLELLHERFAGPEIKIFHRSGIHPIFYADAIAGPDMPNLTYMTPFATLADREKAWDAFGADPEWVKVRAESVARGGQIVDYNSITLWRPTAYSPIQ